MVVDQTTKAHLRNGCDDKLVHPRLAAVDLLFDKAGVNDVEYAVDGERSFCNVGGDDHLPTAWWRRVEYARLHLRGQRRIHRQDDKLRYVGTQRFHAVIENFTRRIYLLLTSQKYQNVT